ncbi:MAG: ABC transporter ATP-binding protein [Clostridia bacterium]|nr:ABC transporter ATP-binding protein [Clostridia bacterium]
MDEQKIIEVSDVSMRFRMASDRITSIKEFIVKRIKGQIHYSEFEALKHVSFDVCRGEVVGLIGRNGAGKSTVLKIISGILKPTEGKAVVRGNVAPMLELGSGFDMDMTGRENIFLNGAILGYSESFLKAKYDEIVEFSEIGSFIDVPLRNYSSGMVARLAFSIATVIKPEVLIVDEVLSVGDIEFQQKSFQRMMELMSGGTTVLFVSHDIGQIRKMCSRTVWLDHGELRMFGRTDEVCTAYEQM